MSRNDLPTGTVTFLFTDVEGSTKLLHELGAEEYAEALAEHRRVLRDAFVRHGGVEVDTQGDAFFYAFPTGPAALEAARASMTERPPWEAEIPLDRLAAAGLRVLLVQRDWCPAPDTARALAGEAFRAVCDVLDKRLSAERAVFPAAHNAQRLGSLFNNRLRAFWEAD